MSGPFKAFLRYTLSFVLTALFLYLAFRGADFAALWKSLSDVSILWVLLLFLVTILSHLARAWRWQYLLTPVKEGVSLRNSFSAVMVGYLVNNLLPRVGEVVRPYALGRLEGVSKSSVFGTVVIERILDMITFLSIMLAALAVYSNSFAELFPAFAPLAPLFTVVSILVFLLFVVMFLKAELFFSFFRRLTPLFPARIRERIDAIFSSFIAGLAVAGHRGKFLMIGVTSYVVWGLYIIAQYIPFFAYPTMTASHLDFGAATLLMVVSGVAFAFPTPSGFGTYHSFTTFALMHLYGIDAVTSLSYAVLTHEVGFIATSGVGLYYWIHDHVRVHEAVRPSQA